MVGLALDAARARLLLDESAARSSAYPVRLQTFTRDTEMHFAFMFTGKLALAQLQPGLFPATTPLRNARGRGTLRRPLLSTLPVLKLLTNQVTVRVGLAMLQVVLLLALGAVLMALSLGTWQTVAGVALLGVAMFVSLGYALTGHQRRPESGLALIMILNFGMKFGGNIFWDPQGLRRRRAGHLHLLVRQAKARAECPVAPDASTLSGAPALRRSHRAAPFRPLLPLTPSPNRSAKALP